jgi:putative two-component system hydrogenase maturation factor HypX/HoxX
MRVLFLTHAFNALAHRLFVALRDDGHDLSIELDVNDAVTREAVALARPDVVVAPFLKRAIPEDVWSRVPCLIVHPGPPGDGGPSSLDRAIQEGVATWGVTVLQAVGDFDAGPVWAHASFPMRSATKGSLYRLEVTEAAVVCVREALARMARGESPTPVAQLSASPQFRPALTQAERAIDWEHDDTLTVLRKVHAADGSPGVRDVIAGRDVFLHGAHAEEVLRGVVPGAIIGRRDGAILRATRDGAVWITHLRAATIAGEPALKLPAVQVLGPDALADIPESTIALDAVATGASWREIRYEQHGDVGVLHFAFHNGAMSTAQCRRLLEALRYARARPAKVLVLAGGTDFWSNGIHLHAIEATGRPADASWENINAIDDVAREIVTMDDRLTVAAIQANAGAGGVFLALAADHVWMRGGVVLNPHYRGMGNLYGSEYWTYLLPRRVGAERAREITERRLPMGSREAVALGLADACFAQAPEAFLREAIGRAQALAASPAFAATLVAKQRARAADEAARPLSSYRDAELARMKLNFYGFDPSYHVARYHFVHRLPKARTPGYLASHRGRAG